MTLQILKLNRSSAPCREVAAWYIPGTGAEDWLEELCRWNLSQESLRLFVVRTPSRAYAEGVLVIPPSGPVKATPMRALALRCIAGKLYLPVDAVIDPPVTDAEASALCTASVTLFHPGMGIVEFETSEVLHFWDLLDLPELYSSNWNGARSEPAMSNHLAGVALAVLPQIDDIFGGAEEEIGKEPIKELPPRPGEPSAGPVSRLRRGVSKLGAAAVNKVFSLLPKGGAGNSLVSRALSWAAAKMISVTEEMQELRFKELHRLMELLVSDPERGLLHALPLAGSLGRGRATPGARLGTRDTRFNLSRLGGGGTADPWHIPADLRQKLANRYRELALQEQRLGRFRRAAYIHAELLGDLSAAAAVLVEGKLFVDAAVLYRDHLRQMHVAAECFVKGALFGEAIAIYETLKCFEELGDLYRTLQNDEAADIAYRRAVETKVAALDFLSAAGLLEEKLRVPDEALALLRKAWPSSAQAAQCLAAEFALLGKLHRHDQASQRLITLRDEPTPWAMIIPLGNVLVDFSGKYPERALQSTAADIARIKVSQRLAMGDGEDARASMQILNSLAPEDRLLARDTSRFLAARLEALAKGKPEMPAPVPRKAGSGRVAPPKFLHSLQIDSAEKVLAVKRCGRDFLAAVERKRHLFLTRGNWLGEIREAPLGRTSGNISLILDEYSGQPEMVIPWRGSNSTQQDCIMPANENFRGALHILMPPWMPESSAAISVSAGMFWCMRGLPAEIILESRTAGGALLGNFSLNHLLEQINEPVQRVSLLARGTHVWMAFDRHLFLFDGGKNSNHWVCETPIIGLEASAPHLARAVVARCVYGAAVFWLDHRSSNAEMLATSLVSPYAAFLGNGTLVLLSSSGESAQFAGQILDLDRRGIHSTADFSYRGEWPAGITATDRADCFAIFTHAGAVHLHRVPIV